MRKTDTISAIATPMGTGGIGIVRISGEGARALLSRVFRPSSPRFREFRPWTLHRGQALDATGEPLDEVLAVFMPGPRTFTGEDVAEIHCHGGSTILQTLLHSTLSSGARLAERGEFTRRAFCNGRMDLTQAEAVAEMIAAPTREAARLGVAKLDGLLGRRVGDMRERLEQLRALVCVAVDFPDEEVECLSPEDFLRGVQQVADAVRALLAGYRRCRCWQQGAAVVLAGAVNAGKSSLMNALLGRNRALVTDIPGTTRDFLEEFLSLDGLPVRLTDTAGLRDTDDAVEGLGVERSRERIAAADLVLLVVDGTAGLDTADREILAAYAPDRVMVVWNKIDMQPQAAMPEACGAEGVVCVCVSARTGEGLEELAAAVRRVILSGTAEPEPGELAPNMRQAAALERALDELAGLEQDVAGGQPYDICAVRLDGAVSALGEVTGLDAPEDVLNRIFSTFCIGK